MKRKQVILSGMALIAVISLSIVFIAYGGNKSKQNKQITTIEQTKENEQGEPTVQTALLIEKGETNITSNSSVVTVIQEPVSPTVEVEKDTYNLGVGEKLNIDDVELSVISTDDYSVTFRDNVTEKTYKGLGDFTEVVKVIDNKNNLEKSVKIKVVVTDTVKPKIYGVKDITITEGSKVDLLKGVTASDNFDGTLTKRVVVSKVNVNKVGKQTVTYSVTDSSGNKRTATATLTVKSSVFTTVNKTMYVSSATINIRADYNADAKKLATLKQRDSVKVIATIKGSKWVKVQLSDGTVGYCSSNYLSDKQPAKPTTAPKPTTKPSGGSSTNKPKPTTKPTPTPKPSGGITEYEKPPSPDDDWRKGNGDHK